MSIPALVDGRLPLGRWPATAQEIEAAFVVGRSAHRQKVWQDWLTLTSAMREAVQPLPAAWLSGSFLTDKDEPRDIDCVYLVEITALLAAKVDEQRRQFLQVAATKGAVKEHLQLSVDSFILEWQPRAGATQARWSEEYLQARGYWDDLWSRERSSDRRMDSVPRRGYLEVIIDGYT